MDYKSARAGKTTLLFFVITIYFNFNARTICPREQGLLKQFKEIDQLPEEEKKTILKVISAYIRDFKTKQAYLV